MGEGVSRVECRIGDVWLKMQQKSAQLFFPSCYLQSGQYNVVDAGMNRPSMFGNFFFLPWSSASDRDVWQIAANRMVWHGPSFSQALSRFGARLVFCVLSCCLRSCVCIPCQPAVSLLVSSRHLLTSGVAHDTSSRRSFHQDVMGR